MKTVMPEIIWPALQNPQTANLISILYQLEKSQWWPVEKLLKMQSIQLFNLLQHSCNTVPFYRESLRALGLNNFNHLNQETWLKIPILTRDQIQQSADQLLSQVIPKSHGNVHPVSTSGSTGKPITVKKTDICQLFWQAFSLRDHHWHRRDFTQKFAAIRTVSKELREVAKYPNGIIAKSWGSPVDLIYPTGLGLLLYIRAKVSEQVEWLTRHNPEYILTLASNAFALAEYCVQQGIKLPNLRQIRTYGEVVDSKVRNMCREAWDVSVIDMYSAEEVGYIALQCPEHEHYHLQCESNYTEILNEQGQPCQPGEIGQIVVTPLHNFAMPLIRYAIGDYAEVGEPCSCGRGLPVVNRILGRTRNMFILPNGDKHWAMNPYQRIMEIAPIKQYQIIQQTLEDIEFRLVPETPITKEQEDKLREMISRMYKEYSYNITFSYPEKIERNPNGKFEDFVSKVGVMG